MRNLIPTLALATTLVFATLGAAAPRVRSSYEVHPELTDTEDICRSIGQMAYDQAKARDQGLSYLQMLSIVRQLKWSGPGMAPMRGFVEANLRIIYEDPRVTPLTTRNETEIVCLNMMSRPQRPRTTTTAKDRY